MSNRLISIFVVFYFALVPMSYAGNVSSYDERSSPTRDDYFYNIGPTGSHADYKTKVSGILSLIELGDIPDLSSLYDANGTAAAAVSAHEGAADPHTGYQLESEMSTAVPANETDSAHDTASEIPVVDSAEYFTGTSVEAVLAELYTAIAAAGAPTAGTYIDVSGYQVSVDLTETDDITWGAAGGGSQTWTFDTGAVVDPTITIDDNTFTFNKPIVATRYSASQTADGPQVALLYEASGGGTNYIGIGSPAANANDLVFLLPVSDPIAGQIMSWAVPSSVTFFDNVARDASQATWIYPNYVATASKSAAYTIGTDNLAEAYGGVIYVTSAATITAPAVADGMSFDVVTVGAIAVSLDVNASDRMYLDGVALDDGDKATNTSTTGDIIHCVYESASGWYCGSGSPDGDHWSDGGA